ncbi:MAG: hypothetical protein IVW53_06150 [Chloroflexi bacterium]|nr:hypothetical protein [Chloroflexota bacterium]
MTPEDQIPELAPVPAVKRKAARAKTAAMIAGSILIGGAVGAAVFVPALASAQSSTASPTAPAVATATASFAPGTTNGGAGGGTAHIGDLAVAAKAIGISESDLATALGGGQTIAAVAKAHNVDPGSVIAALVADDQSELAAAVAAGRITQTQADAEKAEITQRATDQVNNSHPGPGKGGPGFRHQEAVSDTSVVAKAIGISESDLTTALGTGQTFAAIAKAHNVDPATVIAALVADGQSELDAAVKAGTMTQAQADTEKAELVQHATDQVNNTRPGPGKDGPAMGHRPGDNDGNGSSTPGSSAAPASPSTSG